MPDGTTINIEAQDTTFSRGGTTTQDIQRIAYDYIQLSSAFGGLPAAITHTATTKTVLVGMDALAALFADPLGDYETETNALYARSFAVALAAVRSGPASVRGGTERVAFAVSDLATQMSINRFREVWQAELAWVDKIVSSVKTYNELLHVITAEGQTNEEQSIMAQHANAQQVLGYYGQLNAHDANIIQAYSAVKNYGTTRMTTSESLSGKGNQGGLVTAFGASSYR